MIEPNSYSLSKQDLGRVKLDQETGFYRDTDDQIIAFRRQAFVNNYPIRPSEDGTLGKGIYVGNTVESLECFKTAEYMKSIAVIKVPPVYQQEIFRVSSVPKAIKSANQLARQNEITTKEAFDLIFGDAKFVVWKTQVASNIGSLILGHVWPRNAHWGVWRDESVRLTAHSRAQ